MYSVNNRPVNHNLPPAPKTDTNKLTNNLPKEGIKVADIILFEEKNSAYKHQAVQFTNLNQTLGYGPTGEKYPGQVGKAPGGVDYDSKNVGRIIKRIPANAQEEAQVLGNLKRPGGVIDQWKTKEYNVHDGSQCINFANEVIRTGESVLKRPAQGTIGY